MWVRCHIPVRLTIEIGIYVVPGKDQLFLLICRFKYYFVFLSPDRSRAAQTTRKWAAALQMVEEKARSILTKPEFTTLCYYTDEYSVRHMTIDAFVQVITELLNTPDKVIIIILFVIYRAINLFIPVHFTD